jgi:hypothetical protein
MWELGYRTVDLLVDRLSDESEPLRRSAQDRLRHAR